MDTLSYKTISINKQQADKKWLIIDAKDAVLGRLSSQIAKVLLGKHKPNFTPNADCGDYVIVINSDQVRLTGKKWSDKKYVRHTGYPGGQRFTSPREIMEKKSSTILIEKAVRGMIPKTRLGRQIFHNMFVYEGAEHPHEAQQPETITFNL